MVMGRSDRLILLLLLVVVAAWRLIRFFRLGIRKPRSSLGIAGGWLPPSSTPALPASPLATKRSPDPLWVRAITTSFIVLVWMIGNIGVWLALLKLPFLESAPPIVLGIAGVLANFYIIPFARAAGRHLTQRIRTNREDNPQ
jgi:hypothetical protein